MIAVISCVALILALFLYQRDKKIARKHYKVAQARFLEIGPRIDAILQEQNTLHEALRTCPSVNVKADLEHNRQLLDSLKKEQDRLAEKMARLFPKVT